MLNRLYSLRITIFDMIIALPVSCMFAISPQYIETGKCVFAGTTILQMLLYFAGFLVASLIIRLILKKAG